MLDTLKKTNPYSLNVFDLETCREYEDLPINPQNSCHQAWKYLRKKDGETEYTELNRSYREKASLYPEFCRVIAASFGWIANDNSIKLKSFSGDDERTLLEEVSQFLTMISGLNRVLAGIAIIGYDIPLLAKRMLSHGLAVPSILDIGGKKPWDVEAFDLLPVWKMTSFSPASLPMICHCLGIPSPKTDELDGSMVGELYFSIATEPAKNLARISSYCEDDVLAVIKIVAKLFGLEITINYSNP